MIATRVVLPAAGVALAISLCSCQTRTGTPDIAAIYADAAKCPCIERDPVVVIPGIMGSRLVESRTGKTVWGAFSGEWAAPNSPEGARLVALPMEFGTPLHKLQDAVRPDGALGTVNVRLFGLPIRLQAYANIMNVLGVGGYRDEALVKSPLDYGSEHFTCFQFAYDWRRSNAENGRLLHQFLREKADYVRRESRRLGVERQQVRFNVVAHSMGGLVARYQLMYGDAALPADGSLPELTWKGAELVKRVILVGTPNAGSADALVSLVEGFDRPAIPPYRPELLGTFPSMYELLPRPRHEAVVDRVDGRAIDVYDYNYWRDMGWGLADPKAYETLSILLPGVWRASERRRTGLEHQRKCLVNARQFHAALDREAEPPEGVSIDLIAGDAIATPQVVEVDAAKGSVAVVGRAPGDGVVPRSSALLDERKSDPVMGPLVSPVHWDQILFLPLEHGAMTRHPVFSDNLLFQLLERD